MFVFAGLQPTYEWQKKSINPHRNDKLTICSHHFTWETVLLLHPSNSNIPMKLGEPYHQLATLYPLHPAFSDGFTNGIIIWFVFKDYLLLVALCPLVCVRSAIQKSYGVSAICSFDFLSGNPSVRQTQIENNNCQSSISCMLKTARLVFPPNDGNRSVSCYDNCPNNESGCSHIFMIRMYPLVNKHNYGKSQFLMGKLTINGHFQ